MMLKKMLMIGLMLVFTSVLDAQSAPKFQWTEDATDLTTAQGYSYRYYLDGSTTGIVFTNVTCTGTASPFTCTTPVPTVTAGQHSITFTAASGPLESPKSSPFVFTVPAVPSGLRIIG